MWDWVVEGVELVADCGVICGGSVSLCPTSSYRHPAVLRGLAISQNPTSSAAVPRITHVLAFAVPSHRVCPPRCSTDFACDSHPCASGSCSLGGVVRLGLLHEKEEARKNGSRTCCPKEPFPHRQASPSVMSSSASSSAR